MIERGICETLCNIQSSFYSAVTAFTTFERKHNKTVDSIKLSGKERKLWDLIVRIIVIEQRFCMSIKDKMHAGNK